MKQGEDIAECPSCTLQIKVIFQREDLQHYALDSYETLVPC
jgi:hypothetical protein